MDYGILQDPEEIRAGLEEAVSANGIEPLKRLIGRPLYRMVVGTKALDDGTLDGLFAEGYEMFTSVLITVGTEVILAHTEGKERDAYQSHYDFWKANQKHIMELHHIAY